jgi:hypothetical protein
VRHRGLQGNAYSGMCMVDNCVAFFNMLISTKGYWSPSLNDGGGAPCAGVPTNMYYKLHGTHEPPLVHALYQTQSQDARWTAMRKLAHTQIKMPLQPPFREGAAGSLTGAHAGTQLPAHLQGRIHMCPLALTLTLAHLQGRKHRVPHVPRNPNPNPSSPAELQTSRAPCASAQ